MHLSLLRPLADRPGPWASVYADTSHDTKDAAKQQSLTAHATAAKLSELGADDATCGAVEKALAVERTGEPATQAGRALFATEGEVVLDVSLPAPPAVPSTSWGFVPRLTPLLEAVGDDPVCLVVTVDKTGADFALHSSRGGEDAGTVAGVDWSIPRTGRNDRAERHVQSKAEETWEHNAREIAEAAREVFEKSGAAALLLAGDSRERRSVHEKLPAALRAVTYETTHGGRAPGTDTAALDRDIAQVRAVSERAHLAEVTGRFRARAEPAGGETPYAASGVPALVEAAREHQIDTLLVSPHGADAARNVWVGKAPDQVAVRSSELQYLGEVRPTSARADDALVRSAVANGADVLVVSDPAQAPAGGLGAILRWTEATARM
ncbi:baeRF2 domain-containing protein [Streptomyces sp. NPDC002851]